MKEWAVNDVQYHSSWVTSQQATCARCKATDVGLVTGLPPSMEEYGGEGSLCSNWATGRLDKAMLKAMALHEPRARLKGHVGNLWGRLQPAQ